MSGKIIIIGGGIAGLAVGSYLQMNGYNTEIFEMHNLPGGLCTAWTRKGFRFDGCIHWLMGSGPSTDMHIIWKELGAVKNRKFIEWDEYVTYKTADGNIFTMYTDPDRLKKEMLRLGPDDEKLINAFCKGIKRMSALDKPIGKHSFKKNMSLLKGALSALPTYLKWSKVSSTLFASRLKSPILKEFFGAFYQENGLPDFPMSGMMMMLGYMYIKSAGYPVGGSLAFSRSIESRYISLGGKILYKEKVEKILTDNDTVTGIISNGKQYKADRVISAADGYSTIFSMLGGRYISALLKNAYESYTLFPSIIQIGIGLNKDFSKLPAMSIFHVKKEIVLENGALRLKAIGVRFMSFDPTNAPKGKTSAMILISTRNEKYWTKLREENTKKYTAEKIAVSKAVIDAIDSEYSGFKKAVEVVDVSTPATIIRYTGNWRGSYEGFAPTRKNMMKNLGQTLPGLKNFYMLGQWTNPGGGLPPCGMSGRSIAEKICREDKKKFETTEL